MKRLHRAFAVLVGVGILVAGCGGAATTAAPADLLSEIKNRGYIVVSTDPNYEPQSFLNTQGQRPSDTKCASDQLTPAEMQGFDVDVAAEISKRLGVELCFATPDWDVITAGNWADKWDISVGSMTITTARQQILTFTSPYYYTPAVVAAAQDAGIDSLDDLSGQAVCAGTATTYESWLQGQDTGLPASSIFQPPPANVTVVTVTTDQECAQAIAAGRRDFVAYVTSETVVDSNIEQGVPVVKVGAPVYSEDLAIAVDKSHSLPIDSLVAELDKIVQAAHSDGTLTQLSEKWFGADLTQAPSQ